MSRRAKEEELQQQDCPNTTGSRKGPSTKYDLFIRVCMEKIDKNKNFRNVKTPIETLTPVL